MGNIGAIAFLAIGGWLGWQVFKGNAQNFLFAVSGKSNPGAPPRSPGSPGSPGSPSSPTTPQGGPLAGAGFNFGDELPNPLSGAIPTVFGGAFGQNGSLYGPAYDNSPYGPYSPSMFDPEFDPTQYVPQRLLPAECAMGGSC